MFSDNTILKGIKNPSKLSYEITIETNEITFLGDLEKPDFGNIQIRTCSNKCKYLKSIFFRTTDFDQMIKWNV